jgi:hypothetical protein
MGVISNGTTLLDAGAIDSGIPKGAMTLLSTNTLSSAAATVDITSGLTSTYDSYIIKIINMHPANNAAQPTFQVDTGTNTNYNTTIAAATHFVASQNEGDSGGGLGYYNENTGNITSFLRIGVSTGNDNDQNLNATLQLFNPASSTFYKQFILRSSSNTADDHEHDFYLGGIFNTTTAITRVRFKFSAGNIDAGIFKLYGIT